MVTETSHIHIRDCKIVAKQQCVTDVIWSEGERNRGGSSRTDLTRVSLKTGMTIQVLFPVEETVEDIMKVQDVFLDDDNTIQ